MFRSTFPFDCYCLSYQHGLFEGVFHLRVRGGVVSSHQCFWCFCSSSYCLAPPLRGGLASMVTRWLGFLTIAAATSTCLQGGVPFEERQFIKDDQGAPVMLLFVWHCWIGPKFFFFPLKEWIFEGQRGGGSLSLWSTPMNHSIWIHFRLSWA